jgi:hypothetical protein
VQVAGRAVAGKQVLYSIFSQILVRELEVGMYDAISRDAVSLLVCRRSEAKHVGEFRFSSLLEFMHLPTNPEHKLLQLSAYPPIYCDVTRLRFSQTLDVWWPLRLLPPSSPHGPTQNTGVPRFDIAPPWSLRLSPQ